MHARLFLAACASVALLSAGACDSNTSTDTTDHTKAAPDTAAAAKGTSGTSDDQPRPITLTGCLQKDGSDFILTQINEPPKGEPVAQQDLKEAEHAYRLNAKNANDDDWSKLVGRQVHVDGTMAKASDLAQKVGTSGSNDRTANGHDSDRMKIHESDLAQVDVSAIQQVAANCGNHSAKSAAKSAKPHRSR